MYLTVLVLLLSVGASGAHAQRLDLGRMLGDSIKTPLVAAASTVIGWPPRQLQQRRATKPP